jgi:hypothetical protein
VYVLGVERSEASAMAFFDRFVQAPAVGREEFLVLGPAGEVLLAAGPADAVRHGIGQSGSLATVAWRGPGRPDLPRVSVTFMPEVGAVFGLSSIGTASASLLSDVMRSVDGDAGYATFNRPSPTTIHEFLHEALRGYGGRARWNLPSLQDQAFTEFRSDLERHQRGAGYYLVDILDLTSLRAVAMDDEGVLHAAFESLDDQAWDPTGIQWSMPWSNHELPRERARFYGVDALVGGRSVGRRVASMSPDHAGRYFDTFEEFFVEPRRYFVGLGLGSRDYVFHNGIAIVTDGRAGLLGVVESD